MVTSYMPTLLDYMGVSWIQHRWLNNPLADKSKLDQLVDQAHIFPKSKSSDFNFMLIHYGSWLHFHVIVINNFLLCCKQRIQLSFLFITIMWATVWLDYAFSLTDRRNFSWRDVSLGQGEGEGEGEGASMQLKEFSWGGGGGWGQSDYSR